jgi:predicted ATPase/DNA-binding XRE family transcriptional regulator
MHSAGKSPFGVRVRAFREAANLSQEELAERAGMSVSGLSALERGARQRPHAHTLRILAEALGLDEHQWNDLLHAAGREVGGERRDRGGATARPGIALTRFIGREEELSRLGDLLGGHRLVTLLGMAGIGKSRLAMEAVGRNESRFTDGVWLVRLDEFDVDVSLPRAVAEALGVREPPGGDSWRALEAFIADRAALLVLDGCESVLEGCAVLVSRLLDVCPRLVLLAASQASLALPGEAILPVRPLDVPGEADVAPELCAYAATSMYLDRARLVSPDFDPAEDPLGVAELCRRLDGVPLAIELAAARARLLSPAETLSRLRGGLRVLETRRATSKRHRSLQVALEWSHSLLGPAEQMLVRRLGVFAGGFTLEAIERVCCAGLDGDPLALVDELLDRSLVVAERRRRLRMLDTVRRFALDRLAESGEEPSVRDRHAKWFLEFAERADPHTRAPDRKRWLGELEGERENLRLALEWLARHESERARGVRLAAALATFWRVRGGGPSFELLDTLLDGAPSVELCRALDGAVWLAGQRGDADAVERFAARYLRFAEAVGDESHQATALWQLLERGDGGGAVIDRVVALARRGGDTWRLAMALASVASRLDPADPRRRPWLEEAAAEAERVGDSWLIAAAAHSLGLDDLARGDAVGGRRNLARVAELVDGDRDPWGGFLILVGLAQAALVVGDPALGLRLLSTASTIGERTGVSLHMAVGGEDGALVERARLGLDAETADATWSAGARLSYRDALAQGLRNEAAVSLR